MVSSCTSKLKVSLEDTFYKSPEANEHEKQALVNKKVRGKYLHIRLLPSSDTHSLPSDPKNHPQKTTRKYSNNLKIYLYIEVSIKYI